MGLSAGVGWDPGTVALAVLMLIPSDDPLRRYQRPSSDRNRRSTFDGAALEASRTR
jgi:hypothetical protein